MAQETTLVLRNSDPIDFIVADGTGIEKGAVLKMTSPRTAIITSGSGDVFAGIAAREKIASDGRTRLSVFRRGIFRMTASGANITAGVWVTNSGANFIRLATEAEIAAGKGIGIALQDITAASAGEVMVGGY
jgi:hypothetical protein